MKETMRHTFHVDVETFWNRVYFSEDYTRRLHLEGMGCESYTMMEMSGDAESGLKRVIKSIPKLDAPKAVKKVLGDSMSYEERAEFDASTQRYKFEVIPSTMSNKISIKGVYWVEPAGAGKVTRICDLDFSVRIFGVGKLIEQFIAKSYVDTQEKATEFTTRWISENIG